MLPSAVDEAIGLSESGTGNNHLPRRLRSRAAVPTSLRAPGEGPSSPRPLLNCCSRDRLVAPLKWRSNPAGVNRPSTVVGTGAPIASRTGCSTSAGTPALPAGGLSHLKRTGASTNGLPASGGVKLSEASPTSPEIKGGRPVCEVKWNCPLRAPVACTPAPRPLRTSCSPASTAPAGTRLISSVRLAWGGVCASCIEPVSRSAPSPTGEVQDTSSNDLDCFRNEARQEVARSNGWAGVNSERWSPPTFILALICASSAVPPTSASTSKLPRQPVSRPRVSRLNWPRGTPLHSTLRFNGISPIRAARCSMPSTRNTPVSARSRSRSVRTG